MYKKILIVIIILFTFLSLTSCKENYNKKEYDKINLNDKTTWINAEKKYLPSITDTEKIYKGMPFKELIILMGRPERVFGSFYKGLIMQCFCYKLDVDSYCFVFINNENNYEVEAKTIANNENSEEKERYFASEVVALNEDYDSFFNSTKEILPNLYDLVKVTEGMYIIEAIRILGRPQSQFGSGISRYAFELENGFKCTLIFGSIIGVTGHLGRYINEIDIYVYENSNIDN